MITEKPAYASERVEVIPTVGTLNKSTFPKAHTAIIVDIARALFRLYPYGRAI